MHGLMFEQPVRGAARALSPESSERGARHLNDESLLRPLDHALQVLAQNRITFRMRDDDCDSSIAQLQERIRGVLRDTIVAEFDQQVTGLANHKARRIHERVLNVLVGEMKIAAQRDLRSIACELLQVSDE